MLSSVSTADLANAGIQLGAPTASATVSQAAAQQTALQQFPGSTVREAVLADFSNTDHVPAINTLAWAVSLTVPPGLTPQGPVGPTAKFTYLVVFIDATTGQFIMSTSGGKMPSLWRNISCPLAGLPSSRL